MWSVWLAPAFFPGPNMALGTLLAIVGYIPAFACYAWLGSCFPRSGSDYVYVSRLVHPYVGFVLPIMFTVIFNFYWISIVGWVITQLGVVIPLTLIGIVTNNLGLLEIAKWAGSTPGTVMLTVFVILVPALLISFGMKFYAYALRVMGIVTIAGSIVFIAFLASLDPTTFTQNFNSFLATGAGAGMTRDTIITTAQANGWGGFAGYTLFGTLIFMTMISGQPQPYAIAHFGEVKKAEQVRASTMQMLGTLALNLVFLAGAFYLIQEKIGIDLWGSLSYLWVTGQLDKISFPFIPYYIFVALAGSDVRLIVGLGAFFAFGLALQQVYFNTANMLNPVKYLFAQAFDGVLPRGFAYVHPRYHTPMVAIAVMVVGGLIWMVIYQVSAWAWAGAYLGGLVFNYIFYVLGTCVAAILFPITAKAIYAASPIAKYKVGTIPAISILGVLGLIYSLILLGFHIANPALGSTTPLSLTFIGSCYLLLLIYFYAMWFYRKRQGVDLSLAFKEIPPE